MLELLDDIAKRQADIEIQMADPAAVKDAVRMRTLGREHRRLADILELADRYRLTLAQIDDAIAIIDQGDDEELIELAQEDRTRLEEEKESLEARIRELLSPPDPNDNRAAIVEIRAGTGGEEAALFAADLMRMYIRYAEKRGWKVEMLGSNATGVGGFKEVSFSVEGERAYGTLKFESGVHRVQRVPATEASGRIHTSAASVAVLPEADPVEIDISPNDLKIDV